MRQLTKQQLFAILFAAVCLGLLFAFPRYGPFILGAAVLYRVVMWWRSRKL